MINENKKYSNLLIVDVILSWLAEKCREYKIDFKAKCYIPKESEIKELNLIKIFSNLDSNVFEACIK